MITYQPIGQWGNQVFSYVIGRILAEKTGLSFRPPPHWRRKDGRQVTESLRMFQPETVPGFRRPGPTYEISVDHWLDMDRLHDAGAIHLRHGYFQRYELLKPWKTKIKQWLQVDEPPPPIDPEAVYIHCRLTDYIIGQGGIRGRNGVATTVDEYRACLRHFPDAKRAIVCTDDPTSPLLQQFDQIGLPWSLTNQTWDQDWWTLANARWLLISQSTYSWWAGLLGCAERIVCPLSAGTLWALGHGRTGPPTGPDWINLDVDDETRWTWVKET